MKKTDRKTAAVLFSLSFVWMLFNLRAALLSMSLSQSPILVLMETAALLIQGRVAVQAWRSTEPYTVPEKRGLTALLGLYAALNLVCPGLEGQLTAASLGSFNKALGSMQGLVWAVLAVKLLLPAAGVWVACRRQGRSTVVFEEAAAPEDLLTEDALEGLCIRLDDAEVQE